MPSPTRRASVAVVTDAIHPYHRGGKEIRYAEMLPRLQESSDVRVYTMHWWPERSATMTERGVEYEAICPLVALYHEGRRSMFEAIVFALACLRLIARPFDVVEADHMPYLQLFALRLVTKLRRRPLVVTWNEVWGAEYWRSYLGPVSGPIAWWVERTAMSLPDQILAVSAGTAERLHSYLGDSVPIRVIHNAVDLELIRSVEPALPEQAAELLFVGRLLKHKGVDLLIDALATMTTALPLRLLIVGDGPEKLHLEKQVAELGLADVVRFRSDVVNHSEVFALMKAAQVFVFPSLREGFGIAPLEALACGTRVVTTSHPDNQARHLVARSNRGYVSEPTAEALAARIEEALADASLGTKPKETWIEEFDWSAVADQYRDALTCSVAGGRPKLRAGALTLSNWMDRRNRARKERGVTGAGSDKESTLGESLVRPVVEDSPESSRHRLRVVLVGPYGAEPDGIARYSSGLVSELERHECDVKVVTPRRPSGLAPTNHLGDLAGDRHDLANLQRLLEDFAPDIIHVQFAVAAFALQLPALFRLLAVVKCPTVVTAHEVTRDLERMRWPGRLVYRRIGARASCVMVHTHGAAKVLSLLCPETKVRVLPHPVLPGPAEGTSEAELRQRFNLVERDVILMFGFIHPHKGLDDLVAAFASAVERRGSRLDRFALVVAGDVRRRSGLFRLMEVPDRLRLAQLKRMVRHLGLDASTVFTGYVLDRDVFAWFQSAYTVVLPYRRTEQSGVLSLARAFDVPVITSDAGGLGEECGGTWTFPAGDRAALAELLSRLDLERPPRASASFSWDLSSFVAATEAIYRESLLPAPI
jgi:glycosyltransferase involved in cell wall biosynthesis